MVDSDAQRRAQIRYTLSSAGYKVLEAVNLRHAEAICSITEVSIDLVIREPGTETALRWPSWRSPAPLLPLTNLPESDSQDLRDDFWRLPFDPEQLIAEVNAALRPPSSVHGVLMVEDNEPLRRAVSQLLRHSELSVFEAADGASAIALFTSRAAEIDLVLLDLTLPDMTGREVFEAIEQIRPDVKVILTTSYTEEAAMISVGDHRPYAFMHKPYRTANLLKLIKTTQIGTSRK